MSQEAEPRREPRASESDRRTQPSRESRVDSEGRDGTPIPSKLALAMNAILKGHESSVPRIRALVTGVAGPSRVSSESTPAEIISARLPLP